VTLFPWLCQVKAEVNKTLKYNDIISHVDFVPVAIETSESLSGEGNEIGRIAAVAFLRQCISVAVQQALHSGVVQVYIPFIITLIFESQCVEPGTNIAIYIIVPGRTNSPENDFFNRQVSAWNSLPISLVKSKSVAFFKHNHFKTMFYRI